MSTTKILTEQGAAAVTRVSEAECRAAPPVEPKLPQKWMGYAKLVVQKFPDLPPERIHAALWATEGSAGAAKKMLSLPWGCGRCQIDGAVPARGGWIGVTSKWLCRECKADGWAPGPLGQGWVATEGSPAAERAAASDAAAAAAASAAAAAEEAAAAAQQSPREPPIAAPCAAKPRVLPESALQALAELRKRRDGWAKRAYEALQPASHSTCLSAGGSYEKTGRVLITAKIARTLAAALVGNTTLLRVDVSSQDLRDGGSVALAAALQGHPALEALSLGRNQIGDKGASAVAALLENGDGAAIKSLALNGNRIGDAGACALAEAALRSGPCALTKLSLLSNKIGAVGARALAGLVAASGSRLEELSIGENETVGDEGAIAIAAALCANRDGPLMDLDLHSTGISDKGAEAFLAFGAFWTMEGGDARSAFNPELHRGEDEPEIRLDFNLRITSEMHERLRDAFWWLPVTYAEGALLSSLRLDDDDWDEDEDEDGY